MGAARLFRAAVSGAGTTDERVRYYIDGSECEQDHYISQYVKDHGKMPYLPVGKGGSASAEEIAAAAPKKPDPSVKEPEPVAQPDTPATDAPEGEGAQPQAGDALPAAGSVTDLVIEPSGGGVVMDGGDADLVGHVMPVSLVGSHMGAVEADAPVAGDTLVDD